MTPAIADNRARAVLFILLAIFFASSQDAIVKAMSGIYPVYETVTIRCLTCQLSLPPSISLHPQLRPHP